jgi:uncharacterized protein YdaL
MNSPFLFSKKISYLTKISVISLVSVSLLLCLVMSPKSNDVQAVTKKVLVVYDNYQYPAIWADETVNYLEGFDVDIEKKPIDDYVLGDIESKDLTIYVGGLYDNPQVDSEFLNDVYNSSKPVIWLFYNFWKLSWNFDMSKFGFSYQSIDGASPYNQVIYNGNSYSRNPIQEIIKVNIDNSNAFLVAEAINSDGILTTPYLVQGGNLSFFADPVFSYGETGDKREIFQDYLANFLAPTPPPPPPPPPTPASNALILYDNDSYSYLYAQALNGWLGHFELTVEEKTIDQYVEEDISLYDVTFYIGGTYDNPQVDEEFLEDVYQSDKPVVWFFYNIWKLIGPNSGFDPAKYGFSYNWGGIDSTNKYVDVTFKDVDLPRNGDQEMIKVDINNDNAEVIATAFTQAKDRSLPYLVKGRNLYYFADPVFSYLQNGGKSLVLADMLHDILYQDCSNQKLALARVEDVHPDSDPRRIKAVADIFYSRGVPFSISLIPVYKDPKKGTELHLSDPEQAPVVDALRYAQARGAKFIIHGYTHQYDGITADDWEFWDEINNTPVPEDSYEWVADRLTAAKAEFEAVSLPYFAWETPHYTASELDYSVFKDFFETSYERRRYYSPDSSLLQFFPYPVIDQFGKLIIPETLDSPENPNVPWSPNDIVAAAERLSVVRDGYASFYIHLDRRNKDYKTIITGIKNLGYTFIDATTISKP